MCYNTCVTEVIKEQEIKDIVEKNIFTDYDIDFRWETQDGMNLKINEMHTSHIFNAMKMLFNHLAKVWNGKPILFTKEHRGCYVSAAEDPKQLAFYILYFIHHIEKRGDLKSYLKDAYIKILEQVFSMKFLIEENS